MNKQSREPFEKDGNEENPHDRSQKNEMYTKSIFPTLKIILTVKLCPNNIYYLYFIDIYKA